jgi:hypothetical protein
MPVTGKPVALVSVPEAGVPRTGAVNVCCPAQLWAVENTSALSIAEVTLVAPIAVTPPAEIVTSPLIVWQIGSAAAWPTASWAEVQRSDVKPVTPGPFADRKRMIRDRSRLGKRRRRENESRDEDFKKPHNRSRILE